VGFAVGATVGVAVAVTVGFVVAVAVGFIVGVAVGVVVGFVVGVTVGFVVDVAVGFVVGVAVGFTVDVIVAVEVTVTVEIGPSVVITAGLWGVAKELSLSSGVFSPKAMHKMIIIIAKESPKSASKNHGNGFFFTVAADKTVFSSKDFIQYRQNCALSVNSDLQ
jgi:hypothetical protein